MHVLCHSSMNIILQSSIAFFNPGSGRAAPIQLQPPTLTLNIQSQENKSPGYSERVTTLEESIRSLERGIQSGTLCFHFEVFKVCVTAEEWACIVHVNKTQMTVFVF